MLVISDLKQIEIVSMTTMSMITTTTSAHVSTDCPICMEIVELSLSRPVNCLITECGHTFHTSCFLNNVLHNGFGCPYCRRALIEADRGEVNEMRRREIGERRGDEEGDDDIFNQAFYEEEEDAEIQQVPEAEETVGGDNVRNWLTEGLIEAEEGDIGGAGDMGMDIVENNANADDLYRRIQETIAVEGLDEWAEGNRNWNRERRREERAFLGMRIMFNGLEEDNEGFYRDGEWFDWMDSDGDGDSLSENELYEAEPEDEQPEPQDAVAVAVAETEEETDSDTESEGGFDEVMEREHQLSRNNAMPSPYDLSVELQRYGFYIIDYVRILLDSHYPEYRDILANYNSRHTLDSLREAITRVTRQYHEEARIEQEMDMWRRNNQ